MREETVRRKVQEREVARMAGRYPLNPIHFQAHVLEAFNEAAGIVLPLDASALDPMQDSDGSFFFVAGLSAVGGPDGVQ